MLGCSSHLQQEKSGPAGVPGGDVIHLCVDVNLLSGDVASAGDPCCQGDGARLAAKTAQVLGLATAARRLCVEREGCEHLGEDSEGMTEAIEKLASY